MSVVPLTLTISLCLVCTFIIFFLCEHARGGVSSAERDSLLPLDEETPRVGGHLAVEVSAAHDHAEGHDACGGRDGLRAPCAGCIKRPADHVG